MLADGELIARAQGWGHSVTGRQLERWRNAGLLPPLAAQGKGRGRGQARFYHEDPSKQLQELLRLRVANTPIAECAVRLWLTGFDISLDVLRRQLPTALKTVHRFRKLLRTPNFATKFAEYLTRTPRARESIFGDRSWNRERYDQTVNLALGLASNPKDLPSDVRDDFQSVIARIPKFSEQERSFIVSLGGDPDSMLAETVPIFDRIFDNLGNASDAELLRARQVQRVLLALCDVGKQIAALMPNVLSSLLARFDDEQDLHSSYGLFAAVGMLTLAERDNIDILSTLEERLSELRSALDRLQAVARAV